MRWHRMDVLSQLQRAVARGDADALATLCNRHIDAILQAFPSWMIIPETLRGDHDRVEAYGTTLLEIANFFARTLGDPSLLRALNASSPQKPDEWSNKLAVIDAARQAGELTAALAKAEELISTLRTVGSGPTFDVRLAAVRGRQGEINLQLGDKAQARFCLEAALRAARRAGQVDAVLQYLEQLFEIAKLGNETTEMKRLARDALKMCVDAKHDPQRAKWSLLLIQLTGMQGRHDEALASLEAHLEEFRSRISSDPLFLSLHLSDVAQIFQSFRKRDRARVVYEEAIGLRSSYLEDNALALMYNNIGVLYLELSDPTTAEVHILNALNILRKQVPSDLSLMAQALTNLGAISRMCGDNDRAQSCFKLATQAKHAPGPVSSVSNRAMAFAKLSEAQAVSID